LQGGTVYDIRRFAPGRFAADGGRDVANRASGGLQQGA
jgi:hypothetical protein